MPSRISGACNGCRSKKQKCSGDRTGCAQCAAAGIECTWPEQRKRGPAKGYIEALELRLHAAESLLLGILPHVDERVLDNATSGSSGHLRRTSRAGSETSGAGGEERRTDRSSPPLLNKKTGVEYWERFPLDSPINIRRWQENCETQSHGQASGRHPSQSHLHLPSGSRQLREDEYRSSAAAAATMAGMRHDTTSPGTPNSGPMGGSAAGRAISYEGGMSPATSMSIAQNMSATPAPHRQQQQPMWYQQYGPMGAQVMGQQSMNMNPSMDFDEAWANAQASTAMDVDSLNTMQATHQQQRGQRQRGPSHGREPGPAPAPGNSRVGLYQGDFSQNIFW